MPQSAIGMHAYLHTYIHTYVEDAGHAEVGDLGHRLVIREQNIRWLQVPAHVFSLV